MPARATESATLRCQMLKLRSFRALQSVASSRTKRLPYRTTTRQSQRPWQQQRQREQQAQNERDRRTRKRQVMSAVVDALVEPRVPQAGSILPPVGFLKPPKLNRPKPQPRLRPRTRPPRLHLLHEYSRNGESGTTANDRTAKPKPSPTLTRRLRLRRPPRNRHLSNPCYLGQSAPPAMHRSISLW